MTATISYFTTTNLITIPGETNSLFTRPAQTITIDLPKCSQTIKPDANGYVPPGTCNALWNYYPSFAAAIVFSILFGILTALHIWRAVHHRKKWCWVIIVASAWETLAFVFRTISTKHQQSTAVLLVFQIFVLTAPLWVNAFAYIVLARMIHFFIPSHRVFHIPAIALAATFVALDIISFVIQLVGGGMATPTASTAQQQKGINIYMGGIGLQQAFIVIFTVLAIRFHSKRLALDRAQAGPTKPWKPLLYAVYAALSLVTVRIIFRLVEFSSGPSHATSLSTSEAYFYALEAVPMFFALLGFVVIHPGTVLDGPGASMPGLWSSIRQRNHASRDERKWHVMADDTSDVVRLR